MSFLSLFDPVFSVSFKCFLPPPYDTANDLVKAIDKPINRALQLRYIIRHNARKAKKK